MLDLLRKFFDTSKKDVEAINPMVSQINNLAAEFTALSDEQLKTRAISYRDSARNGGDVDKMMAEVFACVREVCFRTLNMRQFDVQLTGGVVLHQGRIAEMKTGEGKTLVAVAPIILNALSGRGSHLVTVNDYLARRDAVWMGPAYHFMGLTVGIIQGQSPDSDELGGSYIYEPGANVMNDARYQSMVPCSRRDAYGCDITYGTNHEFGFDYLRDNMAFNEEDLVMRELHYAMIDEVDSILVDEARTPHIISGPSMEDTSVYKVVDEVVRKLQVELHYTSDKKNHSASLTEEGMDFLEDLLGIDNIAADPRLFHHVNASVKAFALFDKDVDYVVRNGEVVIVDENTGRMMFGRRYGDGLHQALEAKERVNVQRESQTVATITFQNLFRLYNKLAGMTGTAKTEEDEFRKIYGLDVVSVPTHRPNLRQDQPDIIYKTMEAKFRGITWEILRLHTKQQPVLVGTRSIEMSERVSARLNSDILRRLIISQRLKDRLEVKKDLKGDLKEEAKRLYETDLADIDWQALSTLLGKLELGNDVTKGDWPSWTLDQFKLSESDTPALIDSLTHGIPHNVLNAKFHEQEALIIAEAGRKGQVTIATNMAGRGVDILLGGRIEDDLVRMARDSGASGDSLGDAYGETVLDYRRGGNERAAPPLPLNDQERKELSEVVRALGGLFILGTERHESRRIDNQLRGRSGRQGDPGESRFFVALEDNLWKIFNANMMEHPALKLWPPMEEVTQGFLSRMIQKTQERIENHFFEQRKQTLEYDDVLNAQREHIYGLRREVLLGKDVRSELVQYVQSVVADTVQNAWMIEEDGTKVYDHSVLFEDLSEIFPVVDYTTISDLEKLEPGTSLTSSVQGIAERAYQAKVDETGEEPMRILEKQVLLRSVNDRWMEHLQTVEYIREGIGLRGYGQVDPLVAYKRETFDTFQNTLKQIRDQASKMIFHLRPNPALFQDQEEPMALMANQDEFNGENVPVEETESRGMPLESTRETLLTPAELQNLDWSRIGRNDPCPCGSGKKFKECHYRSLRSDGVI